MKTFVVHILAVSNNKEKIYYKLNTLFYLESSLDFEYVLEIQ